jgi:hypothetical protein
MSIYSTFSPYTFIEGLPITFMRATSTIMVAKAVAQNTIYPHVCSIQDMIPEHSNFFGCPIHDNIPHMKAYLSQNFTHIYYGMAQNGHHILNG